MTDIISLWPLLALGFSFVGALIIGYNQIFKIDGETMAVWRLLGILPVAAVAWWFLPFPIDPWFYVISGIVGVAAVMGDVLLMNAVSEHGGRLASTYVPMKILLVFVLWVLIDPLSLQPLLVEPWRAVIVVLGFMAAAWGMNSIRRTDSSWQAVLAVVPVAVLFAVCDVTEKWALPHPTTQGDLRVTLGASVALLTTCWVVGTLPVLLKLKGFPPLVWRDMWPSALFGMFLGLRKLPPHSHILELGCGNGIGTEMLVKKWYAAHVTATDIDDASLARTQFYLDSKLEPSQFSVRKADATNLPFPAERFEAVVSSGVIHHVEDWPKALAEIHRVLKPGGLFYAWEFYQPLLENRLFANFFPHPKNRFTHNQLLETLQANHLTPLAHKTLTPCSGLVVAQKNTSPTDASYD